MLKWNEVARHFFLFEESLAPEISKIEIKGFNVWSIIKAPLFHHLQKRPPSSHSNKSASKVFNKIKRPIRLIRLMAVLAKLQLSSKKNGVLFYAYSGDKLSKDSQNRYFNYLVDGFITEKVVKNFVYAEISIDGDFRKPSPVNADIKIDLLNELAFKHWKRFERDDEIEKIAEKMLSLTDRYFKPLDIRLSKELIRSAIVTFFVEYQLYSLLLRITKPWLLITSEKPGTALLAAANDNNVVSVDLQHGLIDEYHPLYQYSKRLKEESSKMILPSLLGVFGEFHRQILVKNGFWQKDQIKLLGSIRLEDIRSKLRNAKKATGHDFLILLPTQWTVFEETKILLSELKQNKSVGYKVVLKPHPLEPASYKEYYSRFQRENADWVTFADAQGDIYELIVNSNIVLGFDSTTLIECMTLGVPSITIGLKNVPEGIHTLLGTDHFQDAIKCVSLDDPEALFVLLRNSIEDQAFFNSWKELARNSGMEFYETNYYENIKELIKEAHKVGKSSDHRQTVLA